MQMRRIVVLGLAVVLSACALESPSPVASETAFATATAGESPGGPTAPLPTACSQAGEPPPSPVYAFFTCEDDHQPPLEARPVPRQAHAADPISRLEAALMSLVAGPTEEEQFQGYFSHFSQETRLALNGASIDADGLAVVDLADIRDVIPNASTSAGSAVFLAQLNATVFQIEEVAAVEYRIEGSCEDFWEWLQSNCQVVERS